MLATYAIISRKASSGFGSFQRVSATKSCSVPLHTLGSDLAHLHLGYVSSDEKEVGSLAVKTLRICNGSKCVKWSESLSAQGPSDSVDAAASTATTRLHYFSLKLKYCNNIASKRYSTKCAFHLFGDTAWRAIKRPHWGLSVGQFHAAEPERSDSPAISVDVHLFHSLGRMYHV